jgi:hypothetical protein
MSMNKRAVLVTAVLLSVVAFGVVVAQSPQFQTRQTGVTTFVQSVNSADFGEVTVCFKATGLGNTETLADVTLAAGEGSTATARCQNEGGNCPEAANKFAIAGLSVTEQFPIRNGQTTGCITLSVTPPADFCPGNQVPVLVAVDYQDLTLSLPDFGIEQQFGTLSAGDPNSCPPR